MFEVLARSVGDLDGVLGFEVLYYDLSVDIFQLTTSTADAKRTPSRIHKRAIIAFLQL
jgi:hypothetical protein